MKKKAMQMQVGRNYRALILLFLTAALGACSPPQDDADLDAAETFIDAFYSWDAQRLRNTLQDPTETHAVMYYQGWAQAANYNIQTRRPCTWTAEHIAECRITVTDDFGKALGYTATDTFRLNIAAGSITSVEFEGDDPPIFAELFEWIGSERPDILSGPCLDMFAGGKTPGACASAVAQAAEDFIRATPKTP